MSDLNSDDAVNAIEDGLPENSFRPRKAHGGCDNHHADQGEDQTVENVGQGKHQMEITHRQKLSGLFFKPLCFSQ